MPLRKRFVFNCVDEMYATFELGVPLNRILAPGKKPVPLIITNASVPL